MNDIDLRSLFPWARSVDDTRTLLGVTAAGLSDEEVASRLKIYDANEIAREKGAGAMRILAQQFMSPLIFVLIGASCITIALQEPIDTFVILLAVFVNAALGFYQEYRAEHTLENLTSYIKDRCRVIRGGHEHEIDSSALVPGDSIHISLGSRVPADARVVEVNGLSVDESFLTGESLPIRKNTEAVSEGTAVADRTCMVYAGSLVVEGSASAIVTSTGKHTEIGRIAQLVSVSRSESTPLQKSLKSLAWMIFLGIAVIVSGLFVLGISRGVPLLEMMLLSAATAVGAIPEALPIALTVILAVGVERIADKKGIMRSLAAAETLGSTTVVMTDKTGTLTQSRMQVTDVYTSASILSDEKPNGGIGHSLTDAQKEVLFGALLATDAVLENPDDAKKDWHFIGRSLEVNIAIAARDAGIDVYSVAHEHRVSILPFNSKDKYSLSFDAKKKSYTALGAPDVLLKLSNVSKDEYLTLESFINKQSEEGKRIIAVAHMDHAGHASSSAEAISNVTVKGLTFLGVIVLYDPIRPEAADAVRRIEAHGAKVIMLTGDLKGTAISIGKELGWELTEGNVMTGEESRQFTDSELSDRLPLIKIFARVTPEDKLRVGKLYQASGEVVAMTGDGVNDAPSLKSVDIGIALGSGSDVAKSAADLVLLDDNFKTIVLAIEEGRRIVSNIRKAFVYLMSNCLDEVFLIGGSLIFALPLPLTAIQIIWVNFFTGSLPALSFAFDENKDVGHGRGREPIFNTEVHVLTVGIGVLTSILLFVFYWSMLNWGVDLSTAKTVIFLCFSGYILIVAFSLKSLQKPIFSYPLFDNRALNWSIFAATMLIAISIAVPFLRDILSIELISPLWALAVVAWLIFNVLLVEMAKWLYRVYS